MERKITKKIYVGNVPVGGGSPISIQSMTNTITKDVFSTARQINEFVKEGCNISRSAVNDLDDALAIKKIKSLTTIPFIADIQYDYKLAIMAAENGADCLRINPGNIGGKKKVKEVVKSLKVKIVLDNKIVPAEYIELLTTEFKKDGFVYRVAKQQAEDIVAIIASIVAENEKNQGNNSNVQNINDPITEVKRFKDLLDNGIITQEEFEKKKKELLNL